MILILKKGFNFSFNGVHLQALNFIHGFQRLLLYSTEANSPSSSLSDYLKQYLGFSHQQSLSIPIRLSYSRKLSRTKNVSDHDVTVISNANLVVNFFKHIEFDETLIRKLICYSPRILVSNVNKTLKPKIELLQGIGLCGSDLSNIISACPRLLVVKLNFVIETLRQVVGDTENVVKVLKLSRFRLSSGSTTIKSLFPNVQLLENYGIPKDLFQKHIVSDPLPFLLGTQKFKDVLIRVEKKLGIPRDTAMFLYGVRVLARYSEKQIKSKFLIYKSFGWAKSDIMALMRSNPHCLGFSDAMIKIKLDFLMGELGYQPAYLASSCNLFTYSLERRIVPRHKVLLVLKAKGLIRMDYSLSTVANLNESRFVNKFVLPYEEVHRLYAELVGCSVKLLTRGRTAEGDHS